MEATRFASMGYCGQASRPQRQNAEELGRTLAVHTPGMAGTRQIRAEGGRTMPGQTRAQTALEGLIQEMSLNEQKDAAVDEIGIRIGRGPDARYRRRENARDVLEGALQVGLGLTLVPGTRAYAGGNDLRLPWAVFGLAIDPQADGSVELHVAWRWDKRGKRR